MKQVLNKFLKPIRLYLRLLRTPFTYDQDGLATIHNAGFMHEPNFVSAYQAGKATGSWGDAEIHWRAHVACWAAARAAQLPGDFVECGVNRGGLAMTTMRYTQFAQLPKRYYLLDTFHGLVEKYITPLEKQRGIQAGGYTECYEHVCQTFEDFANVKIVRGAVPETLPMVDAKEVAYLSIDMNCVEPEIAAAEFFWPKLVTGAIILLDDYGWTGHEAQKEAFDQFAKSCGTEVLSLPTGQGLIIKA